MNIPRQELDPQLNAMMQEIESHAQALLENPDATDIMVRRFIDISPENWVELREQTSDVERTYGDNHVAFYLVGTTNPVSTDEPAEKIEDLLQTGCPHGPVFSYISGDKSGVHGLCLIDPSLFRIYPGLDDPELQTLTPALLAVTSVLSVDDIDERGSYRIPTEIPEVGQFDDAIRGLLELGTVHTRKTRHIASSLGRTIFLQTNVFSDSNLPENIRKGDAMHYKPITVGIVDAESALMYTVTDTEDREVVVRPKDPFENEKEFATDIIYDDDGKPFAWSVDMKKREEHFARERALGMYTPTRANVEILLSALVDIEV